MNQSPKQNETERFLTLHSYLVHMALISYLFFNIITDDCNESLDNTKVS